MNFLREFYSDGSVIRDLNKTFITLIPKILKLETTKDYRPISLVGSMYKLLAKVLSNRLKRVMNSVIALLDQLKWLSSRIVKLWMAL